MNSIQRIQKFFAGLIMLLGSVILVVEPEDGYYVVAVLLSISMLLSGIRLLVYYFTMARYMVGGKSILYRALVLTDLGAFTLTAITIPKIYLICHLLISHGFSGIVDMLKAAEDKKLQAGSWRMSFATGLGNLVIAVIAFTCMVSHSTGLMMDIYCAGLAYSGLMKMADSFRKTAIVYIP